MFLVTLVYILLIVSSLVKMSDDILFNLIILF